MWLRGARSHLHHRRPSEDEMKFISRGSGEVGKAGTALANPWGHEEPSCTGGRGKFHWQEPGVCEMGRSRDAAAWGRSGNSHLGHSAEASFYPDPYHTSDNWLGGLAS